MLLKCEYWEAKNYTVLYTIPAQAPNSRITTHWASSRNASVDRLLTYNREEFLNNYGVSACCTVSLFKQDVQSHIPRNLGPYGCERLLLASRFALVLYSTVTTLRLNSPRAQIAGSCMIATVLKKPYSPHLDLTSKIRQNIDVNPCCTQYLHRRPIRALPRIERHHAMRV